MTALEQLPARMDALSLQVSQLRDEMHADPVLARLMVERQRGGLFEGIAAAAALAPSMSRRVSMAACNFATS